jgi:hypothetical protein
MAGRKDKPKPQPDSTIERFRNLLRSLLAVPKKDLDAALEAGRCAKESDVESEE